jgi:hypothetical protein
MKTKAKMKTKTKTKMKTKTKTFIENLEEKNARLCIGFDELMKMRCT